MKSKYKIGLVIGRFQPFHKGHAYLISEALIIAETIVIAIGSSNKKDENNPWNAAERKKMLEAYIQSEHLTEKVIGVFDLPDMPDDNIWFENVKQTVGPFDVVIGNNDWVKGIFEGKNIPVVTVNHFNRGLWEGYKIRELIKRGEKWEDRVPENIVKQIP